jgi:hypothetical protein
MNIKQYIIIGAVIIWLILTSIFLMIDDVALQATIFIKSIVVVLLAFVSVYFSAKLINR